MARALRAAGEDSGAGDGGRALLARAQSLRVIVPLSWRYVNPGLLVSERLGITPQELALTAIGGNNPQTVVNRTALQIAAGELDVALLTGAECIFTRRGRPPRPGAAGPGMDHPGRRHPAPGHARDRPRPR